MRIVTIDTATGAATDLSTMDTPLEVGDMPVIVDFNPMADRLRFMTAHEPPRERGHRERSPSTAA